MYFWFMIKKNDLIIRIKKRVKEIEPGATIILYGSYARGDNTDTSDFDILILLDKNKISQTDEKRIKYPLYELEFEVGKIISPLVLSKSDWETRHRITPFYDNVIKEGVKI